VRTHLVVLDRYFHDGLVDASSGKLKGPVWMARLLSRFAPKPDLLLFLGSKEEAIPGDTNVAAGKDKQSAIGTSQEFLLPYRSVRLVASNSKMDQTVKEASQLFMEHLAQRFQNRHARWIGVQS
jgi:hypothetical protein